MSDEGFWETTKEIFKHIGYFAIGFVTSICASIYSILSLPILFYRWIICSLIHPFYPPDIVKPVDIDSVAMATEFLASKAHLPPRTSFVTHFAVEGRSTLEFVKSEIISKWIQAKDSLGEQKYPELQMYIEEWMGFMFWKRDNSFSLNNHIFYHEIDASSSFDKSEKFANDLMERLLNKKFTPKRSPWELHVVNNYKARELIAKTEGGCATLYLLRLHHAITDGVMTLTLLSQQLFETPLENVRNMSNRSNEESKFSLEKIFNILSFPFRVMRDIGFVLSPAIINEHSPFYVGDKDITNKQMLKATPIIPMEKVKTIKKKFGVNFTSIIAAAVGVATGKHLKRRGKEESCRKLNFCTMLPLPNHPDKLVNYLSFGFFEVNTNPDQEVIKKLIECDISLNKGKSSTFPSICLFAARLLSFNLARIVSKMVYVTWVTAAFSNFPASNKTFFWDGKEFLTSYFSAGLAQSVAGLAIQILGYIDQVRIVVNVDSTVMSREELHMFSMRICKEIDKMYEIVTKGDDI